jgi:transposase
MEPAYRRCCGIDVHKKSVTVCVLPPVGTAESGVKTRVFRTFTRDLRELRGWLKHCRVSEVIMESTGQYWRAVWNVLEGEIARLVLMNPAHVKGLDGRKTDCMDARWLAEQLESRRLKGCFVPPRPLRELRDLTRARVHLLQEANRVKNRITQLCESGNLKISSVASDLFGVSGRRMLQAVVEARHDAGWIADYARGTLRSKPKQQELRRALEGTFTDHQRSMLAEQLKHLEWLEREVSVLETEIRERMLDYQAQMELLVTIPGVDRITAWTLLAELGPDMSVFDDAQHAASWAGLCPGNRESGGKRLSGRTRKANPYLRRTLCQAAWAASHTKGTYLAACYRRVRGNRGHNKAIVALAHQLLIIAYHLLGTGQPYRELGEDYFDQRNKPKVTRRLVERLTRLGFAVTLQPIVAPAPVATLPTDSAAATSVTPIPPRRGPGRPCKCASRGLPCSHKNSHISGGTKQSTP